MKNKLFINMTLSVMGFSIGTAATSFALEYAKYGNYISCLLIPVGLIIVGTLSILLTSTFDGKEQKINEEEKNTHV